VESGSREHVTLAEVLERTVSPEAFNVAVEALSRRLESEGVRDLLILQFYAQPDSRRIGAVLTFANPEAFMRHVGVVSTWEEFSAFTATVRLVDIRVYGELPSAAATWVSQFGEIGQIFPRHVAGFARSPG
jgi:hypothetical protein